MTILCDTLKSNDSSAAKLCDLMSAGLGRASSTFDCGETRIDYSSKGALPRISGADGKLDAVEIYQAYLKMTLPPSHQKQASAIFSKKFSTDKPWILDAKHEAIIENLVNNISLQVTKEIKANAKADKIFIKANAILKALRAPKARGGLELVFRNHNQSEADINLAMDRGFVRCSEFQVLYYAVAMRMGLNTYPISIPQQDIDGSEVPHVAMMIVDAAKGKRYFADIQIDSVQATAPYQEYYVDTEADMFATYLLNKSMVPDANSMSMSAAPTIPLKNVESIAPHNALAQFALGLHYMLRKDATTSLSHFRKAASIWPNFTSALEKICLLTFDKDECAKANASRSRNNAVP
ncbi:MAG: hypothetical protein ABH871_09865 [Pseudomonadota bacterium]